MTSIGEQIKKFWEVDGIKGLEGAAVEKIAEFEEMYDVELPSDFFDYLRLVNGTSGAVDDECIQFHGLNEIQPLKESWSIANITAEDADSYFVFADFLIYSHVYAIQLFKDPRRKNNVAVFYDDKPIVVARNFSEFIAAYFIRNPFFLFPH